MSSRVGYEIFKLFFGEMMTIVWRCRSSIDIDKVQVCKLLKEILQLRGFKECCLTGDTTIIHCSFCLNRTA